MPAQADDSNGRVTMAVLGTKLDHLREEVAQWRQESRDELRTCQAANDKRFDDHEQRLRTSEGNNRQGLWRDLGAFAAAIAAGIAGVLTGKP